MLLLGLGPLTPRPDDPSDDDDVTVGSAPAAPARRVRSARRCGSAPSTDGYRGWVSHRTRISNFPQRLAAGVFILNAGVGKLKAGTEQAAAVHGMASGTYPFLSEIAPEQFAKVLGTSEVLLGGALILPLVSDRLAGLALASFAGGLLGLYAKTPGLREEGSIRPSQQGTAIAKDVWLLGIGVGLVIDSLRRG